MRIKKSLFLIYIFSFLLYGCATTKSINLNYAQIDFSDGISKKEAITIVQKMYVDGEVPEEARNKVSLSFPIVQYDGRLGMWIVTLTNRHLSLMHEYGYEVYVNAKTGAIENQWFGRKSAPYLLPHLKNETLD